VLSANGWPVDAASNSGGCVWSRPVAGTGFDVDVAIGDAEVVLVHVVRRFHYEIDTLLPGEVVGFKRPGQVSGYETDHASGTAVDIRPGHYPPGVRGGFTAQEVEVIRDILAECDGVVRWGGDLEAPDEAHFWIGVPPGDERLRTVVARLRAWTHSPHRGAGVVPDVRAADRRRRARALERRQRGHGR